MIDERSLPSLLAFSPRCLRDSGWVCLHLQSMQMDCPVCLRHFCNHGITLMFRTISAQAVVLGFV